METAYDKETVKEILDQYKIEHDEHLIEKISKGIESDVIKNMMIDGHVKNGKIQLVEDDKGFLHAKFRYEQQELEIPKKIFGTTLSEELIERLKNHEKVLIETPKGKYQVRIDDDLNSLEIRSDKEIKLITEILDYKLSTKEQEQLLNEGKLGPKVYYDKEKNIYFTAEVNISKDRKSFIWVNAQEITAAEAQDLKEKLNNNLNLTETGINVLQQNQNQEKESTKENSINKEIEKNDSAQATNLQTIKTIISTDLQTEDGYKSISKHIITKEEKKHLLNSKEFKNLSPAEQKGVTENLKFDSVEQGINNLPTEKTLTQEQIVKNVESNKLQETYDIDRQPDWNLKFTKTEKGYELISYARNEKNLDDINNDFKINSIDEKNKDFPLFKAIVNKIKSTNTQIINGNGEVLNTTHLQDVNLEKENQQPIDKVKLAVDIITTNEKINDNVRSKLVELNMNDDEKMTLQTHEKFNKLSTGDKLGIQMTLIQKPIENQVKVEDINIKKNKKGHQHSKSKSFSR